MPELQTKKNEVNRLEIDGLTDGSQRSGKHGAFTCVEKLTGMVLWPPAFSSPEFARHHPKNETGAKNDDILWVFIDPDRGW